MTWTLPDLGAVANVACKPCNEGWLSNLEGSARNILAGMITRGDNARLSASDLSTVAAFAFKCAVTSTHLNRSNDPFFPVWICRRFSKCLEIPSGIKMWSARYHGGRLKGHQFGYGFRTPLFTDLDFYAFNYMVGHLIIQVLVTKANNPAWEGKQIPSVLSPNPIWNEGTIQIWPSSKSPIHWPPPKDLDDQHMKLFFDRWKAPIEHCM